MSRTVEQDSRLQEKLRRELGPQVLAELENPKTEDVLLNPDGLLWVKRAGEGFVELGPYSQQNALSAMGTIAAWHETGVNYDKPILECELPIDGSRFEGIVRPVVSGPSFAIRTRATQIYSLDQYRDTGIITVAADTLNGKHRAASSFVDEVKAQGLDHTAIIKKAVLEKKSILVVGATGSGKTTLVSLIPRLFDVTGGRVEVDGVDVRDLDPDLLWSRIGLVPQKPYLFTGTIASNLRYGKPDATEPELWDALRVAQAEDFVYEKDGRLESPIAQGGTNVSGGQRQRLAIARALVKKPSVYVFDDSFSALDVTTDARLRAALEPETADASVLVIAQRVSTITSPDEILVLEDGEIVGRGTHEQLLASNPTYQEIVESQLSVEEAAA